LIGIGLPAWGALSLSRNGFRATIMVNFSLLF
jgi:hypothetical protein